ncbi:dr1-associated corepressor [Vairimorpha necatrix]|uniref:Dr1-associated corepressor n=1 Tax=Vairimorpha necatrix TaxID=6039 RepID=A0AAX4J892_9MICR
MTDNSKKLRSVFPAARLKKIMQSNEEVGKMGVSVPFITSKALEMFIEEIVKLTYKELESTKGNRITVEHIRKVIKDNPKYEFLSNVTSEQEM